MRVKRVIFLENVTLSPAKLLVAGVKKALAPCRSPYKRALRGSETEVDEWHYFL